MRLGIVSDLHCNAAALRLALDLMGDVDEVLCAGDVVYEYRFDNEVIEILREREALTVLGNHDSVLLSYHGERARSAAHVDPAQVAWLADRSLTIELEIDGRRLLMTHASPCEPFTQYVYPRSPELARLAAIDADYVVIGHTHAAMAEQVGKAMVINPGSVGDPRDPSNGRQCSFAVLDTGSGEVEITNFPKPS